MQGTAEFKTYTTEVTFFPEAKVTFFPEAREYSFSQFKNTL